jgi:hypothetical protein
MPAGGGLFVISWCFTGNKGCSKRKKIKVMSKWSANRSKKPGFPVPHCTAATVKKMTEAKFLARKQYTGNLCC